MKKRYTVLFQRYYFKFNYTIESIISNYLRSKINVDVCGFLIMSRDISVEPRNSMLSVFILIRSIRLVDINTN